MVERKKESVPFVECVYKRVAYKHIQNVKKEKNTLDNQINQHLTIWMKNLAKLVRLNIKNKRIKVIEKCKILSDKLETNIESRNKKL